MEDCEQKANFRMHRIWLKMKLSKRKTSTHMMCLSIEAQQSFFFQRLSVCWFCFPKQIHVQLNLDLDPSPEFIIWETEKIKKLALNQSKKLNLWKSHFVVVVGIGINHLHSLSRMHVTTIIRNRWSWNTDCCAMEVLICTRVSFPLSHWLTLMCFLYSSLQS